MPWLWFCICARPGLPSIPGTCSGADLTFTARVLVSGGRPRQHSGAKADLVASPAPPAAADTPASVQLRQLPGTSPHAPSSGAARVPGPPKDVTLASSWGPKQPAEAEAGSRTLTIQALLVSFSSRFPPEGANPLVLRPRRKVGPPLLAEVVPLRSSLRSLLRPEAVAFPHPRSYPVPSLSPCQSQGSGTGGRGEGNPGKSSHDWRKWGDVKSESQGSL